MWALTKLKIKRCNSSEFMVRGSERRMLGEKSLADPRVPSEVRGKNGRTSPAFPMAQEGTFDARSVLNYISRKDSRLISPSTNSGE